MRIRIPAACQQQFSVYSSIRRFEYRNLVINFPRSCNHHTTAAVAAAMASSAPPSSAAAAAAAAAPKTCKVILADTIAKSLLAEVKRTLADVQGADYAGRQPCLAAYLANDDPAAVKYAEWSGKACEEKYVAAIPNGVSEPKKEKEKNKGPSRR